MKQKLVEKILLLVFMVCALGISQTSLADENHLITGTWSSACAAGDAGNFVIETFKFAGHSATYSIHTYRDAACTQPLSTLTTYRTFKLGDSVPGLADTRKLDYVFHAVTMTYLDPSIIVEANKSPGYYGFTNWVKDQPKNVANLRRTSSSTPEHHKGEKFYTIVKITSDKLYMGDYDSGAGDSEATRLSAIYKVPFIKAAREE
jgi:hypothetical protein